MLLLQLGFMLDNTFKRESPLPKLPIKFELHPRLLTMYKQE
jgi:hypothetical protein